MYREDIAHWIETIHRRTADSDAATIDHARRMDLPRTNTAMRKLAQALLDERPTRLDEGDWTTAPDAQWGSWIEGVPFLHAAMLNRDIVVDLIPAASEEEFIRHYKCRPAQFLTIYRRLIDDQNRRVYVNIRDYDPSAADTGLDRYANSHETLGVVFKALAERGHKGVYLNAVRRRNLLLATGTEDVLEATHARVSKALSAPLDRFLADRERVRKHFPQAVVRGGAVPPARQIVWRIAYHFAFAETVTAGMYLDADLGALLADTEAGRAPDEDRLADAVQRATMLHHKFTAPLTGAYGGTYNLDETEFAGSDLVTGYRPIDEKRQRSGAGFLEVMYGLVQGDIKLKKGGIFRDVLEDNRPLSVHQSETLPSAREVDTFFDNMEPVQQWLRRQAQIRQRLQKIADSQSQTGDPDSRRVLELLNQDLKANRSLFSSLPKAGAAAMIGLGFGMFQGGAGAAGAGTVAAGAALSSIALPVTLVAGAATLLGLPLIQKMLEDRVCNALCTMDDVKQVWRLYERQS